MASNFGLRLDGAAAARVRAVPRQLPDLGLPEHGGGDGRCVAVDRPETPGCRRR
ncbi:MAG: hypothetical protein MZW92_23320 [Comamonadaceae bacterium]|nr:hypothetical protein [Comamonadaceae bacterium]